MMRTFTFLIALLCLSAATAFGDNLTGTVVDEDGRGLPGVI